MIAALRHFETSACKVCVITDSEYVVLGAGGGGGGAAHQWQQNGWVGSRGPLTNVGLWVELLDILSYMGDRVQWVQVPSHVGLEGNEIANDRRSLMLRWNPWILNCVLNYLSSYLVDQPQILSATHHHCLQNMTPTGTGLPAPSLRNMFRNHRNIFQNHLNMFQTHRNMFRKRRNMFRKRLTIFGNHRNMVRNHRNMFRKRRNIFGNHRNMFRKRRNIPTQDHGLYATLMTSYSEDTDSAPNTEVSDWEGYVRRKCARLLKK